MNWPIQEKSIAELYLDQKNIRTPISEADQNALIRDMFDNENAYDIAKSYSANGVFPDEFPIGTEEEGRIILIEGNRRLSALKALYEPSIVPSWQRRIEVLRNQDITHIRVVMAPTRELAIKHIANKHTVDYRRPWKPLRQAYFYKSQIDNGKTLEEIATEFPEHSIPRFIKMLEMHHLAKSINVNGALSDVVSNERSFPITNLERFYNDKKICKFLGIRFDPMGRVIGEIDRQEFSKGFRRIIEDVASGAIDSRRFNTSKEREVYLTEFPSELKPDTSKKQSFSSSDFHETEQNVQKDVDPDPPDSDAAKKDSSKSGQGKPKKKPKGLFHKKDVPFRISSTSLKLMYTELSELDVLKFPNATHDLLRSFLECALLFYLKEVGEYENLVKGEKHNPKLSEMLTYIFQKKCRSIQDEHILQVAEHIKKDYSDSYSLERMNMINHNENWNSSEREVRSAWGKVESLVKVLIDPKN